MNSDRAEMNDIIDHLNAWCDEDELVASACITKVNPSQGEWTFGEMQVRDDRGHLVVKHTWPNEGEHIARHDPARVLAEVEVVRQVISDYRTSDGAILRGDPDPDDPGWRGIYAGRDAFASVLRAYAKAAGWRPTA